MNTIYLKHLFSRTFVLCVLLTFRFQHCASAVLKPVASMDDDTRSAIWENQSLVGCAPRRTAEANMVPWLRGALAIVGYSETEYEKLVTKLGRQAAAEVVLLMVTRRCTAEDAKRLGCPWQIKAWSGLSKLQQNYNEWVIALPSIDCLLYTSPSPRD